MCSEWEAVWNNFEFITIGTQTEYKIQTKQLRGPTSQILEEQLLINILHVLKYKFKGFLIHLSVSKIKIFGFS